MAVCCIARATPRGRRRELDEAIKAPRQGPSAYYQKGQILEGMGDTATLAKSLREGLELSPTYTDAIFAIEEAGDEEDSLRDRGLTMLEIINLFQGGGSSCTASSARHRRPGRHRAAPVLALVLVSLDVEGLRERVAHVRRPGEYGASAAGLPRQPPAAEDAGGGARARQPEREGDSPQPREGRGHQLARFRRGTASLPQLSNLATLLGLLGTIHGLIISFSGMQGVDAAARQAALSKGVAVAFYNTFFGLTVATVTVIAYLFVSAKQGREMTRIEAATARSSTTILLPEARKAGRPGPRPGPELSPALREKIGTRTASQRREGLAGGGGGAVEEDSGRRRTFRRGGRRAASS